MVTQILLLNMQKSTHVQPIWPNIHPVNFVPVLSNIFQQLCSKNTQRRLKIESRFLRPLNSN